MPDTSLFRLQSHTAEKEEACFKYSSIFQTAVPILRFFSKQQSETDAVRIGVSYNRARLFYKMWSFLSSNFTFSSSKPNSEKNWPSFSFKAFGYARVLALQSAKKSNFGKF